MAELHIELLGRLQVRTGAGRELRVVSRKAQALLGCLALQPGVPHSRDMLAGLLWEDSDPELARASLRQALASLRRSPPEFCATALRPTIRREAAHCSTRASTGSRTAA